MNEKNLNTVLRVGDPAGDERLSQQHAAVMRRQIVNAARRPDVVRTPWQQPLAVAAMIALTIATGIIAGQRLPQPRTGSMEPVSTAPEEPRRQLQFSTPGGTRIIWVFDPEFTVKETVP